MNFSSYLYINININLQVRYKMFVPRRTFITFIKEYERGVKYFMGRYTGIMRPGINLYVPILHNIFKVDIRSRNYTLDNMSIITNDGATIQINGNVEMRVVDPTKYCNTQYNGKATAISKCKLSIRDEISSILYKIY